MEMKYEDMNLQIFLGNCDDELVSGRIFNIPDGQISASSAFDDMSIAKYSRFHTVSDSDGKRYAESILTYLG